MSDTKNKQMVREVMLSIYGEGCWMGYKLTKENPYTYHHILEARNGGKVTIDNGAILTKYAHHDLNELENRASYLYCELNDMFKELNETRKPPTREYFKEVNGILLRASKIIKLSNYCELEPDFVMLEEFAQIIQESNPELPSMADLEKAKFSHIEEEVIEIPKHYTPKIKRRNRERTRNRSKYIYY